MTLRTRLGWETTAWRGFSALAELENNTPIVDDYNSGRGGDPRRPVIADARTTELNRAQLGWKGEAAAAVLGRQRVVFDNGRFVGNSAWRQNERTYDAGLLSLSPNDTVKLTYGYVDDVRNSSTDWESDSHLVRAEGDFGEVSVTAYTYLIDLLNAPNQSSATAGVRLNGEVPINEAFKAAYEAEFARQESYGSNPADFQLEYIALSGRLETGNHKFTLGYELLGGNGRVGLLTPLASSHGFQGWSDAIQSAPAIGLREVHLKAATKVEAGIPLKLSAAVYDFRSDVGDVDLGRELNLAASTPINDHVSAELKFATFDGETTLFKDRDKVWFSIEYKY